MPRLFVGSGKADEIRMLAQMHGAVEVLFDQALSPAQQRNLERHLELPVTTAPCSSSRSSRSAPGATRASCRSNLPGCNT